MLGGKARPIGRPEPISGWVWTIGVAAAVVLAYFLAARLSVGGFETRRRGPCFGPRPELRPA